jgi:N-acetyl-anhydromuramyl-L-alanine amidase AmpD
MKKGLLDIEKENTNKIYQVSKVSKTQIMLGHTSRNLKDYLISIGIRNNGKYSRIPHYIITKEGKIKELIKPNHISNFFGDKEVDTKIISVLLENNGWLTYKKQTNRLCDWLGNIYKGEVFEKKWRNKFFWSTYSEEQLSSLNSLLENLCDNFDIKKEMVGHNVRINGVENFKGIVSRSNYSEFFTDLSPAFNFDKIKEII